MLKCPAADALGLSTSCALYDIRPMRMLWHTHLAMACTMADFEPGWPDGCRQELAAAVVGEGLRPLQSATLLPALGQLLDRCWAAEPGQRPSFVHIAEELRHMQVCQQFDSVAMTVYEKFAIRTVIVNGHMVSDRLSWKSIGSNVSMHLSRSQAGSTVDNIWQ